MTSDDGHLPSGWISPSIGEIATRVVVGYVGPVRQHYVAGGIPFLMGKNIKHGALRLVDLERVSPAFHGSQPKSALSFNDVVVVRIGRSGEAAVIPEDLGPANCGGLVVIKEPFGATPSFLAAFLNSPQGQKQSDGEARGMTRKTLNTGSIEAARVPLPPLSEQRRIVAKLETLAQKNRRAKEALDAIPPLLERFRQSVLASAFRGDLTAEWRAKNPDVEPADKLLQRIRVERRRRWEEAELAKMQGKGKPPADDRWKEKYEEPEPVETENLRELPEGWAWADIKLIAPLQSGFAFSSTGFRPAGVRLLKGVNVRDGWLATEELHHWSSEDTASYEQFRLSRGDVVIAMDRPVYSSGTKATKVVRLDDAWHGSLLLQRVGRFRVLPSIDQGFIYSYLQSSRFRNYLIGKQNGSQDGKDLPHVSGGVIDAAIVPVAPLQEQRVVEAIVTERLAAVSSISSTLNDLQGRWLELDRSILAKAFRGELVPQDPTDEPASVLLDRIRRERAAAELAKDKKAPKRGR